MKGALRLAGLSVIAFTLAGLSLFIGYSGIEAGTVLEVLSGGLFPGDQNWTAAQQMIVLEIRLPRAVLVTLVGASLGLSGAVLQAVLKNPLASPYLLGISSGASVGASIVLALGVSIGAIGLQAAAFAGGLAAVVCTYVLANDPSGRSPISLILAGVIVSAFCSAVVSLCQLVADVDRLQALVFWLMGGFSRADWSQVLQILPVVVVAGTACLGLAWQLNGLSLGAMEARALGVNTDQVRGALVACVTLMTAACVCVAGPIGWVGLVAPHVVRMTGGANNAVVLPGAAACGAAILLASDLVARNVTTIEVPIGIVTALMGAPFFVWVLRATGRKPWLA